MKLSRALIASATILAAGIAASGVAASAADTDEPPTRDLKGTITDRTSRYAGTDRYETAAAISRNTWAREDVAVIYLATGTNYPDALAMSASTGGLGPILFVTRDVIPEATRTELLRLTPCEVVAVGGSDTVSDGVLTEAGAFASPAKCQ